MISHLAIEPGMISDTGPLKGMPNYYSSNTIIFGVKVTNALPECLHCRVSSVQSCYYSKAICVMINDPIVGLVNLWRG